MLRITLAEPCCAVTIERRVPGPTLQNPIAEWLSLRHAKPIWWAKGVSHGKAQ